jgi:hypothetical protein
MPFDTDIEPSKTDEEHSTEEEELERGRSSAAGEDDYD